MRGTLPLIRPSATPDQVRGKLFSPRGDGLLRRIGWKLTEFLNPANDTTENFADVHGTVQRSLVRPRYNSAGLAKGGCFGASEGGRPLRGQPVWRT